ncbi:MAG: hypothetical protein HY741_12935 [Chloroflexi bacterium]|nr:hypothetical protein [Chloroflexota bacterium]
MHVTRVFTLLLLGSLGWLLACNPTLDPAPLTVVATAESTTTPSAVPTNPPPPSAIPPPPPPPPPNARAVPDRRDFDDEWLGCDQWTDERAASVRIG